MSQLIDNRRLGWIVNTVPMGDIRPHRLDDLCSCGVVIEVDVQTHVSHRAYDGRETFEDSGMDTGLGWENVNAHGEVLADPVNGRASD